MNHNFEAKQGIKKKKNPYLAVEHGIGFAESDFLFLFFVCVNLVRSRDE